MIFYDGLNLKKIKIFMEKVAGEQSLALQHPFPQMDSKFFKNSNRRINLLVNARDLKLGHFGILDMLFPFWLSF